MGKGIRRVKVNLNAYVEVELDKRDFTLLD